MSTTVRRRSNNHSSTQALRTQAIADFDDIISNAQDLVKATAAAGEDQVDEIRKKLEGQLEAARDQLVSLEENIKERAKGVDNYVHENPWQSIGIAAGVGVLIGAFAARK